MADNMDNATPDVEQTNDAVSVTKAEFDALMKKMASLEKQVKKSESSAPAHASIDPASLAISSELAAIQENERYMQELVDVRLFKDNGKYKDDVFVAVNGKTYQIKRGVNVKVPRFVDLLLNNSMDQDLYAARYSDGLAAAYEASNK